VAVGEEGLYVGVFGFGGEGEEGAVPGLAGEGGLGESFGGVGD